MNKTKIHTTELKLDEAIHYALTVLTKRHRASEEFKSILSKRMFLKSNTKGFIHVMHFLFNILDPKEFKKRFYWPIYDKNAENSFRSSCVDYYNHIISKHDLNIEKIKAFHVVIPGGLKFMKILLPFINFIIKEDIRRSNAKSIHDDFNSAQMKEALDTHSVMIRTGTNIKLLINTDCEKMRKKCNAIESIFSNIFHEDSCNDTNFNDFIQSWHLYNTKCFGKIELTNARILDTSAQYSSLMQKCKLQLEPNDLEIDNNCKDLNSIISFLMTAFPETFANNLVVNNKIKISKIPEILINIVLPEFHKYLSIFTYPNIEMIYFEENELKLIYKKTEKILADTGLLAKKIQYKYNDNEFMHTMRNDEDEYNLRFKCITTPNVLFHQNSYIEGNNQNKRYSRIALLEDDTNSIDRTCLFMSNTSMAVPKTPKTIRKKKNASYNNTGSFSNKRNIAKNIFDDIIAKPKSQFHNKNKNFSGFLSPNIIVTKQVLSSTMLSTASERNVSFSKNIHGSEEEDESIIVARNETSGRKYFQSLFPEKVNDEKKLFSIDAVCNKHRSPIIRMQNDALQIRNVNSSPTGRLTALVSLNESDKSFLSTFSNLNNLEEKTVTKEDTDLVHRISPTTLNDENEENNLNLSNLQSNKMIFEGLAEYNDSTERILDISDSILVDSFSE